MTNESGENKEYNPYDVSHLDTQRHDSEMKQIEGGYELHSKMGVHTIAYVGLQNYFVSECGIKFTYNGRAVTPQTLHRIERIAYDYINRDKSKDKGLRRDPLISVPSHWACKEELDW